MPLGEKLWEEKSKAVVRRVMDVSERGIHAETTFTGEIQGFGRLKGIAGRTMGTDDYWEKLTGEIITGTACGVLTLQDEFVPFKAVGIGKLVRRSPVGVESLLSLIYFVDPPESLSWMRNTLVIWEAMTDPKTHSVTATAYEWTSGEKITR